MNVLIARTKEECLYWKDNAVVVDVLRTATTACALLKRGKTDLLLFADQGKAAEFKARHPDFELYSDLVLDGAQDDSPYEASRANAKTPAMLVSAAGTPAVFSLREANQVFLGGFCNFYTVATVLKNLERDVLLVPAALFDHGDDVEDGLCVSALKDFMQGFGRAEDAVEEIKTTLRYIEYMQNGPKTAAKDAKIAFDVNDIAVVPEVTFVPDEDFAVCHLYGTEAPKHLVFMNKPAPAPEKPADPQMPQAPQSAEESAVSAEPKKDSPEHTTSKLKSLFKEFIKTVKEEKEELAKDLSPAGESRPAASAPAEAEDPMDAVLKKAEPSAPQAPAQTPVPAAQAVVPAAEVTFSGKAAAFGDKKKKKAIVLFSGGLDSTTCLFWAISKGYECEALTVSYGQRHDREVISAEFIAKKLGIKLHHITLNLPWLGETCSLVDKNKELPDVPLQEIPKSGIPSTYVPGRNLMFLSVAASLLDAVGADAIVAGPNAVDFSGYPDCTPAFFKAAADAINRGTKMGVTEGVEVLAPLMRLSKTEIVRLGVELNVPFDLTWSCYAGGTKPCGHCDSCKLRAKGFAEAGVKDPSVE